MEIYKTTLDEVNDLVFEILSEQKEAMVYCIADENCAVIGTNGGADLQNIQKLNLKTVEIKHEGGTIILSPGDVDIGIFTKGYEGHAYRDNLINLIIEKAAEKGYKAVVSGNDVLINGRKVIGFGSRYYGEILYTAIHIAVYINLELIKTICTKKMSKTPDALSNYGIYTTDILDIMSVVFIQ